MTLGTDVQAVLDADATLAAVLTGGVYAQDSVGEISRQNTPGAFDGNAELLPCALVGEGTETPRGPYRHAGSGDSVQTPIIIYFYEREGYVNTSTAMERVLTLLNRQRIGSGTWRLEYESSIRNQADQTLEASLEMMRFVGVRLR